MRVAKEETDDVEDREGFRGVFCFEAAAGFEEMDGVEGLEGRLEPEPSKEREHEFVSE
ncbi:hypothetical protein HK101_006573, partial [Irineochytrium annulatum]